MKAGSCDLVLTFNNFKLGSDFPPDPSREISFINTEIMSEEQNKNMNFEFITLIQTFDSYEKNSNLYVPSHDHINKQLNCCRGMA